MDLRIFTEPQEGAGYDDLLRVAKTTEDAGYSAFFRSDHYLAMGGDGRPGPTDAWITLAGLARETSRVRLGTLVSPATFRHPGPLAISVAQVDRMSGGRVEFGFGSGWFGREHAAYGLAFPAPKERFDLYSEQLEIITGLWKTPVGEQFSFSGRNYTVTDSPALPKPAQSPGPPVILGGGGKKRTPELAARFADEFNLPFAGQEAVVEQFARVDAAAEAIGRDPKSILRSVALTAVVGRDDAEVARRAEAIGRDLGQLRADGLAGTPAEVVDRIGQWREKTGVTRLYLQILDLADLGHIEYIAAEVAAQL
ncbi:LLM class F420-dependent oxidoreductase [Amycolatopsis sp. PS_44_ISF1]|uniref:LLM class F420-dependent oxidoreductase n=1 Tax=Amycolatopsis sp. PS_44_ISF1 TaxID=2974917 RepID=UPI0028DF9702|nr:LLM class F420-dependent oxidoreductase [Amycolatopsis sp. PS_44_ISF1]MDT8914420.1 LLM class F420-dependent oxidoreductase [Amycolatopsis sp. PS_44_ISF1]